jgi:hypothetical protein
MSDTIWVAIISAFATVITAIISLYPDLIKKRSRGSARSVDSQARSKKTIIRLIVISVTILIAAITANQFYIQYHRDQFEVKAERNAKNPYVVESATAVVKYDDSLKNDGQRIRHTFVRIVYVLRLLKDISLENDSAFVEEYMDSRTKPPPEHWYGTEPEAFQNDNGSRYSLSIQGKKGEMITVVTGATYTYPIPLTSGRITPQGSITLTGDNDYYAYSNKEDYIKNLTIVLESSQIDLNPYGALAAFSVHKKEKPVFGKIRIGISDLPSRKTATRQKSISMHWTNVEPQNYNGIIYQW